MHLLQHALQHRAADLASAPGTPHPPVGASLARDAFFASSTQPRRLLHRPRQIPILRHKPSIDPIFPHTDPASLPGPLSACGDGGAVAGVQQGEGVVLRRVLAQRLAQCITTQIVSQRHALAHGIDSGARAWKPVDAGNVSRREDLGMADALQGLVHPDEASGVENESCLLQPCRCGGAGGNDNAVGMQAA